MDKGALLSGTRPRPLSSIRPGEKVALFYRHSSEMYEVMAELVRGALERHEMAVIESRAPLEQAGNELKALGVELSKHPEIMVLPWSDERIRELTPAFISDVLRQFSALARTQGFSGATLIQDVPEGLVVQVPLAETWRDLDRERRKLRITVASLYDVTSLPPNILVSSLTSYPTIILQGNLCHNFYYLPQDKNGANDPSKDLQQRLNQIRTESVHRVMEDDERSRLRDINEQMHEEMAHRRMSEFALLQAENNTRIMLDAMADLVFMVDRGLKVTQGNQALVSYLEERGMDTAFEGRSIFELFPGLPSEIKNLYDEVFAIGQPTLTEEAFDVNGHRFETEVRRVPVFSGDVVDRIVVILRQKPMSELMRPGMWEFAELLKAEVLEPHGPLRGTKEKCPHMVLITDTGGRLFDFNQAACDGLGYTREELEALGSTAPIFAPTNRDVRLHRRYNFNGRMSMPATLGRKDGSRLEAICYFAHVGQGDGHKVITVLMPNR